MTWILIACVSVAVNVVLLILLFMSARRSSVKEHNRHYEVLYRRALILYADLSSDYINLLSCMGTGLIPKRLNKTPSVNDIFSK